MTELAAGAVSSLLVVIRNEALLLSGVKDDVQFIKEEMESMNSFLAHLARSAPPGGDHDEQVRTWMNQVRLLAHDCNNCIDLYLYSGNPDIHRAKGRLRRYLWWAYWFLRKMVAQHRAAVQLRQLKDRARDVGERRLRYGVEIPEKTAAGRLPPAAGTTPLSSAAAACVYAAADDEEDSEDQLVAAMATHHSGPRAVFEARTLDDYVKEKLLEWAVNIPAGAGETLSIAMVAPDADKDVLTLALQTLVVPRLPPPYDHRTGYHRGILVSIPAVHPYFLPLRTKDVLYYILRDLKKGKTLSQKHVHDQGEWEEKNLDSWQQYKKWKTICTKKEALLQEIQRRIENMKTYEKLDKIKEDIIQARAAQQQKGDQQQLLLKNDVKQMELGVLLLLMLQSGAGTSQLNQMKNKGMHKLLTWDDNNIKKIANKLKKYMEKGGEGEERKDKEKQEDEKEEGIAEQDGICEDRNKEQDNKNGGREKEERQEERIQEEKGVKEEQGRGGEEEEEDFTLVIELEEPIRLHEVQYIQIIHEVFLKTTSSKPLRAQRHDTSVTNTDTKNMMTILDKEQIKQMIHEAKQEVLRVVLHVSKNDENQAISEPSVPDRNQEAIFEEIIGKKIEEIKHKLKEQMEIKGIVDKIKHHLKGDCPLTVLKVDDMIGESRWEEIRKALSLLECSADALIFTTTESIEQAKGYCYPQREPIDYSLVGLYHDTVLELTSQQKIEENYDPQLFRSILEECVPHEFCMKIFTHALFANPNRSNEELIKLHSTLNASSKSFEVIAKKMFMYSYNDLPKEYKSCFLYLAIFPKGPKIRRSTLIERWIAEGLILKEDWPSSVRQANRCFDALIHRWLVYPADISATGKVKSCVIDDIVHGFITTIARKQHFVETRLSQHLARHFSIFNDLQLRSSDGIDKFFQGLSRSSRVSLLKVLDLEGCQCFGGKNQRYLKDICSKMLLLKYLSLRGTDITQLPREINHLRELEVLDVRQTKVPEYATKNILLLKLKRLLAGRIDPSPSNFGTSPSPSNFRTSVQIPHRIDKMEHIEALSNVKAQLSHDLKDIGKLWQLRKLGVAIKDKDHHLGLLLQTISDLHESLCSLSITTLPEATPHQGTPSRVELPDSIASRLQNHPKILESLSIIGITLTGHLLPVITRGGNNKLAKVTLSSTLLNQNDLKVLSKLPKLLCLRLRHVACAEGMLTFRSDEFTCLKYLLIEGSDLTNITFEDGAALELKKMALSLTSPVSISGVQWLPKLEELELNNKCCGMLLSSFDNAEQISKVTLCGTLLKQDALQILAKKQNIRSLVLLDKSFEENEITFEKDGFPWLNHLVVDYYSIIKIHFINGSSPRLQKIVWSSFTSLCGIDNLIRLKELEFNGELVPDEVKQAIKSHKNKPKLKYNER